MKSALLTFRALTPLHVGSGTSVSYVDLPIAREKHTGFPIIPGSGIKGVLRDLFKRKNENNNDECKVKAIFGPEPGEPDHYASAVAFTDAKILFYPVRSLSGVYALITSPLVLKRFSEDIEKAGGGPLNLNNLKVGDDEVKITQNSLVKLGNGNVVLEEFVFNVKDSNLSLDGIENYLPSGDALNRVVVVSDDIFTAMVKYAVEIRTRIRMDQQTGTVAQGALFSIEMVPAEAIFYSLVFTRSAAKPKCNNASENSQNEGEQNMKAEDVRKELGKLLENIKVLQIGGDETVGLGFTEVKFFSLERSSGQNKGATGQNKGTTGQNEGATGQNEGATDGETGGEG